MNPKETDVAPGVKRWAQLCVSLVAVLAGLALLGWTLGTRSSAGLGGECLLVAPSAATALLLFALGLLLHIRAAARAWSLVGSAIVSVIALTPLVLSTHGIRLAIKHPGLPVEDMQGSPPQGHMSSLTAFCLFLAGLSYGALLMQEKAGVEGGTETVLVAEDDETLRRPAADGQEAPRVLPQHAADIALVMLDMVMPRLGGKVVYETLKPQYPNLRFLFSSGYSTNAIHTGLILNEGIELIQKP